ncbi:putative signal peptide protein [Puccinia sorghi]|uniref:Putative signal peptide protein n=1 Tax=Puccinia sorghi TaxID=27349 RepID=A0A0L6U7P5_9BASI|nr:putative signal peptide protein [Puccinia sorghi]
MLFGSYLFSFLHLNFNHWASPHRSQKGFISKNVFGFGFKTFKNAQLNCSPQIFPYSGVQYHLKEQGLSGRQSVWFLSSDCRCFHFSLFSIHSLMIPANEKEARTERTKRSKIEKNNQENKKVEAKMVKLEFLRKIKRGMERSRESQVRLRMKGNRVLNQRMNKVIDSKKGVHQAFTAECHKVSTITYVTLKRFQMDFWSMEKNNFQYYPIPLNINCTPIESWYFHFPLSINGTQVDDSPSIHLILRWVHGGQSPGLFPWHLHESQFEIQLKLFSKLVVTKLDFMLKEYQALHQDKKSLGNDEITGYKSALSPNLMVVFYGDKMIAAGRGASSLSFDKTFPPS